MRFERLLELVGEEPLFETGLLLVGDVDPADIRRQLSRWREGGKIILLRRGLYALAPLFRKVKPHPFVVANRLVRGSYVSLHSALAYHGLIPEYVPAITSMTTRRAGCWATPLGRFEYRHMKAEMFFGYRSTVLEEGLEAFVAIPEKALLDLVYLEDGGDAPDFLEELRLQNLEKLNLDELDQLASTSGKPKLKRAATLLKEMVKTQKKEYRVL